MQVSRDNVSLTHQHTYNLCPANPTHFQLRCDTGDVYPGANLSMTSTPAGGLSVVRCSNVSKVCRYRFSPPHGGDHTFHCSAVNSAAPRLSNQSQLQVYVRGEFSSNLCPLSNFSSKAICDSNLTSWFINY